MFNQQAFEDEVYELVTRKINEAFSRLLKEDKAALQTEGMNIYKQVVKSLHFVVEESALQIVYGLLMNLKGT